MLTFNTDLILTADTTFDESITVNGDIRGNFDLKVKGDIDARNINAHNIVALDIVCQSIKIKEGCKVMALSLITDRFNRTQKDLTPKN